MTSPPPAGPALPRREALTTLLLDAGGVLVDPDWDRAAREVARAGLAVAADALRAAEAPARRVLDRPAAVRASDDRSRGAAFFRLVLGAAAPDAPARTLDAAAGALRDAHARENLWTAVPAGVPDALARFRAAGLRLVVVSNADGSVGRALHSVGLLRRVDRVVDSGVVGVEKPDPAIFRIALEAEGAPAGAALHAGDFYEIDVVGARAAGIAAVLVDAGDTGGDRDCARVPSLAALADALLGAPG